MRINEAVTIVGGGIHGIGLSQTLDCNVYLIDGGSDAAIIDAGAGLEATRIVERIGAACPHARVSKLLLTHTHLDHAGGAAEIASRLDLEVFAPALEAPALEAGDEVAIGLEKAKRSGIYPPRIQFTPCRVDNKVTHGDKLMVGELELLAVATPGHSRGHTAWYLNQASCPTLFSGDSFFLGGAIALQNLPDSSLADYDVALDNLEDLNIEALIPSHYGFTLGYGRAHLDIAREALRGSNTFKQLLR